MKLEPMSRSELLQAAKELIVHMKQSYPKATEQNLDTILTLVLISADDGGRTAATNKIASLY